MERRRATAEQTHPVLPAIGWQDGSLKDRNANLILIASAALVPLVIPASISRMATFGFQPLFVAHVLTALFFVYTAIRRKRHSLTFKASILTYCYYASGITAVVNLGVAGAQLVVCLFALIAGCYFLGRKVGLFLYLGILVTIALACTIHITDIAPFKLDEASMLYNSSVPRWVTNFMGFTLFGYLVILIFGQAQKNINDIEEAASITNEQISSFLSGTPDGLWCISYDPPIAVTSKTEKIVKELGEGVFSWSNDAFAKIYGLSKAEEVIGVTATALAARHQSESNAANLIERFVESGLGHVTGEAVGIDPQGKEQIVRHSFMGTIRDGKLLRTWGVSTDISDTRSLEVELRQRQKMDAIGQLAGGIAHDSNNVIAGILAATDLIKHLEPDRVSIEKPLDIIAKACGRAADLNKKLLTYARKGSMEKQVFDVNTIIKELVDMLARTIDPKITISYDLHPDPAWIAGDPTELQSALLNLGVNARDAMQDGGNLHFANSIACIDEVSLPSNPQLLPAGDYVQIAISDTGAGMSTRVKEHIFEPFFTTKAAGEGTGLGLAAVYGTVHRHHGIITVDTALGKGTTFDILLPLTADGHDEASESPVLNAAPGRILITDDEEQLRYVTEQILAADGWTVLTAENGKEACIIVQEGADLLDVLLIDLTMPILDGEACIAKIRRTNKTLPILLTSGMVSEVRMQRLRELGIDGFLPKPYNRDTLVTALSEAIQHRKELSQQESSASA